MEQLSDRVFVAPGGVNIGVVRGDGSNVILIDTGLNDTAVRKVLRQLDAQDLTIGAIITTHGHADHFGGNAYTVRRTGAEVWAPAWDEMILRYPLSQPVFLFAGADPPGSLRNRFLLADASPVDHVYDAGPLTVCGVTLEAISLAGHSGNQMGILVDGVFFCADVVLPAAAIEKHKMPYVYSVRDHLQSLERAASVECDLAVAGHGPVPTDLAGLIDLNRKVVMDIAAMILDISNAPVSADEILASLLSELGAAPSDPGAYFLLHPTIYAFLTYLEDRGELRLEIDGGRALWSAASSAS